MSEDATPTVNVENASSVNVPGAQGMHPVYVWMVSIITIGVLCGFGYITYLVLAGEAGKGVDAATKGSVIQTWNNLAVAAAAVWTGTKLVEKIGAKP